MAMLLNPRYLNSLSRIIPSIESILTQKRNATSKLDHNNLDGLRKIEVMDTQLLWAPSVFSQLCNNHSSSINDQEGLQLQNISQHYDVEQLEEMRDRGHLFYKLDNESRESEELSFNFHRRKARKQATMDQAKSKSVQESKKHAEPIVDSRENKSKLLYYKHDLSEEENLDMQKVSESVPTDFWSSEEAALERKKKLMSFKEITDVYMHPFCLDIFISKSSVCACIVHRVTSKVVVVAQSISKDMKRELGSTKDLTACASVGGLLAQRALADDIYTAIYTPRKGEKLEGKLMVVLQSLVDHGVDIKVRLKQRRPRNCTYMGDGLMVKKNDLSL